MTQDDVKYLEGLFGELQSARDSWEAAVAVDPVNEEIRNAAFMREVDARRKLLTFALNYQRSTK